MLSYKKTGWALAASIVFPGLLLAQKEIALSNPSFEDIPNHSTTPQGWYNCGFPAESPPDVQPGAFYVSHPPSHGRTYLGLVVRDNETYEAVGQRLTAPLEANQCYEFALDLCRSETYLSLSRTTGQAANYAQPVVLHIWGGHGYCDKRELLDKTDAITTTQWRTYTFTLRPRRGSYTYLMLEAFYKTPTLLPYNGNVLLDNATTLRQVACETPTTVKNSTPSPPTPSSTKATAQPPTPSRSRPTTPDSSGSPAVEPSPAAAAPSKDLPTRDTLKQGATFQVSNLYFDADKYDIKPACLPALEAIYHFLIQNPDIILEVGGHTNELPSYEASLTLSTLRAKAVAEWLVNKGIPAERIQYKGYGKTKPIDTRMTDEAHRRNQRVEFKILSMREN
ncbi:MAG: OmpA family protein [Saprospiraceae bacterium]|nr:OmpA family protein [Saprospiraceae bacterium]MDW8229342.1 OmpA family protein [Saprospiraceae bacterium]